LVGKHDSGIPKLAARRGKSNRVNDPFPGQEADEALNQNLMRPSGRDSESFYTNERADDNTSNRAILAEALEFLNPKFIDDEDDYDEIETNGFDPENHPDVSKDAEGNIVLSYDPENPDYEYIPGESDLDSEDDDNDEDEASNNGQGGWQNNRVALDPEEAFFERDLFDFDNERPEDNVPEEIANRLLPLNVQGPGLDDFLEANFEHPSKYAEVRRYNYHAESLREPRPNFPKNRVQPTAEFVTSHQRFLYVSGLPHFVDSEGELGDLENPIHRLEVAKAVSDMLGVKTESISPASMTTAFVGYKDKKDMYTFFLEGPQYSTVDRPLKISEYTVEEGDESGFAADDAIIKLEEVPGGVSVGKLAHTIFPQDTEMGSIYGPLSVDDIKQLGPTTVLVRMKSKEQVASAMSSSIVQERLVTLGHYDVQFFRARRELHFQGVTGPNKGNTFKRRGNRLAVEIDTPSKEFFQSHAGVIQLRNVDVSITREEISKHFEAFSVDRRDVTGSAEFATCSQDERTDIVYVGFERYGEAEAAVKACSGRMSLGKGPVGVRLVKELFNPAVAASTRESRPDRSEQELLESNNWKNFVDPEEVMKVEAMGISTEALADAFQAMRYHNLSYGSLDWGMKSEKMNPGVVDPGQQMRETMQLYIDTLKDVAEGEDADLSFEDMFTYPEEDQESDDIDGAAITAEDEERLAALSKQRKSYFMDS
jgi:hypothetical protein